MITMMTRFMFELLDDNHAVLLWPERWLMVVLPPEPDSSHSGQSARVEITVEPDEDDEE